MATSSSKRSWSVMPSPLPRPAAGRPRAGPRARRYGERTPSRPPAVGPTRQGALVDPTVDLDDVCGGLERFITAEVDPLHDAHADVLEDPRRRYRADGSFS